MTPVTVTLPLQLTGDMLRAVRQHPTTSTDDKEEEHRRIGWLLCAWDVLVAQSQAAGYAAPAGELLNPEKMASELLRRLRDFRDMQPHGDIRSALNEACDRLDVAASKIVAARL